ncbi:MAG TPA: CehA/McbA family metallohydrolase [Verrucomicrobiae bacterium]|nr:CehA/McbA family metallohydrolase [Verrucomicrobiae bacterium]
MNLRCFLLIASLSAAQVSATAAEPERVNAPNAFGGIQPVLSPDGRTIALSCQGAICRLPSEGGTLTRLTRGEGWDIEPAWSPDGKQIAYINAPGFGAGPLRLIAATDGSPAPLPKEILARGRLQFHPDGTRLLGMFTLAGQPDRLQWLNLSPGELTAVNLPSLDAPQRSSMKWALSPDGAAILLATFQDRPGEQSGNNGPAADLWQVPAPGGEAQRVIRWPSRIYGLCWDAAGHGAYVVTDRGVAYNDLWHLPLDRPLEAARKLTFGQADEDWPSVSQDGRWLAHTENHQRATELVRRDLTSGQQQTLSIDRVEFREPTGRLRLLLKDAHTGDPVTARVSVKQQGGKYHFPFGSLYRLTSGAGHFYAREAAELILPAGQFTIQAWHGPEYLVHQQSLEIVADRNQEVTVAFDRWINMPEKGWFSGENHIHANYGYGAWHNDPETVRDQCEAENLHVANVVVANSDGDGVFDRDYFLGRPDPLSSSRTIIYWNEEFRSTIWGHLTLGQLSQLVEPIFTGFKDTTNPWDVPSNADIAQRTHTQRGTVSYTHPASTPESLYDGAYAAKGLPVDAALGRIDTLDVMGSGYEASLRLWYRLLNCGFRLPAAAGTDVFLNRITSYPPGWGRCYVKLTNGLSYAEWMRGQKDGRSFITTGPTLEWTAAGLQPGDTLRLDSPNKVRVQAQALSQFPIKSLELIANGTVVAATNSASGQRELTLNEEFTAERSGWMAVRCASGSVGYPGSPAFGAHSNPIYLEVQGHPLESRADAQYFLAWIDRLEADLKKRDRLPGSVEQVRAQLETARGVYHRLIGTP